MPFLLKLINLYVRADRLKTRSVTALNHPKYRKNRLREHTALNNSAVNRGKTIHFSLWSPHRVVWQGGV